MTAPTWRQMFVVLSMGVVCAALAVQEQGQEELFQRFVDEPISDVLVPSDNCADKYAVPPPMPYAAFPVSLEASLLPGIHAVPLLITDDADLAGQGDVDISWHSLEVCVAMMVLAAELYNVALVKDSKLDEIDLEGLCCLLKGRSKTARRSSAWIWPSSRMCRWSTDVSWPDGARGDGIYTHRPVVCFALLRVCQSILAHASLHNLVRNSSSTQTDSTPMTAHQS